MGSPLDQGPTLFCAMPPVGPSPTPAYLEWIVAKKRAERREKREERDKHDQYERVEGRNGSIPERRDGTEKCSVPRKEEGREQIK